MEYLNSIYNMICSIFNIKDNIKNYMKIKIDNLIDLPYMRQDLLIYLSRHQ